MKRVILLLLGVVVFLSALGWGQVAERASTPLTLVSVKRHHATRHHAHKAGKHRKPRHHRTV